MVVCLSAGQEVNLILKAGYPGYKQPKFRLAPKVAEGRSLYYRKTPKVEKYQSAVHELYMRPFNFVSFATLNDTSTTKYAKLR